MRASSETGKWSAIALLILSAICFASLSVYLSGRRIMWSDELLAWNLLTDPSWHHMIQSWSRGADSGGPLFYLLARPLLLITGPHPLTVRLFSAFCLWLAAVLWWGTLRQTFSGSSALIALFLIWLCNGDFVDHLAEVRFYVLFVLAATVSFSAVIWIEEKQPSDRIIFLVCFLTNAFLISAHMLGLIYSAVIVVALLFATLPPRRRLAAIGGAFAGWLILLAYLPAIRAGAGNLTWILLPGIRDLLRFYLHSPTVNRYVDGSLLLFVTASLMLCLMWSRNLLAMPRGRRMLLVLCLLLFLIPAGFYVVSHIYKPIFAGRYMMPFELGFAGMVAGSLWLLERRYPASRSVLLAGLLCLICGLHILNVREQSVRPLSDISSLTTLNSPLPIVIADADVFLKVLHYGNPSSTFIFPLPDDPQARKQYMSLLISIAEQGYAPGMMPDSELFARHRKFMLADLPSENYFYSRSVLNNSQWTVHDTGVVQVNGETAHMLLIEHR